jgi:hypothetical protein
MMARFRIPALVRAFRSGAQRRDDVHFHRGPQGRPDACFDTACRRPRLDVD